MYGCLFMVWFPLECEHASSAGLNVSDKYNILPFFISRSVFDHEEMAFRSTRLFIYPDITVINKSYDGVYILIQMSHL